MSSPAERLAAAKAELESHFSSAGSLAARSLDSSTPRERLAAAREQFNAAFNGMTKRSQPSPAERLTAAKNAFAANYGSTGLDKRDGLSPAERLAAAKDQFASHVSSAVKRDGLSPADRLAAAKEQFASHLSGMIKRDGSLSPADRLAAAKEQFASHLSSMVKRDDNKEEPVQGEAEMPVSNFQKTVVPIVIGLVLLAIFGGVAGFIVFKRRQKNKAKEAAEHRRKNLDLEDDGADEDFGYELPQGQRVQDVGFNGTGASVDIGRKRTSSLKGAEGQPKRTETREHNSKEFV